ncbi:class E sortase [Actinocorallia sp. A-T 12471]|uniref:class E sortase n=1 Tax=Actinocorallia sp. A-T 12471 TaxID=3089813 RepID=UPI0029D1F621|nr:class E sortase [Actinocorallia sp. A-T 12471]MDX6744362.1 class E sortase [Actinocorallia sp. A-T 12471]
MRTVVRLVAELCVTAGLILALLVAHLLWGTDDYTRRAQKGLNDDLDALWRKQTTVASAQQPGKPRLVEAAPDRGDAFAVLRIPRFEGWRYAAVEGVTNADLAKGPGHYPGTPMPGQKGNSVFSGHRTTYGAPFNKLGELVPGDQILIDTATRTYVYRMTSSKIVLPTDMSVLAPVPGKPGAKATKAYLTLTTCHPKFSAAYRLIIFAELARTESRASA